MKKLMYDVTKLMTVANFAKLIDRTPTRVHQLEQEGKIEFIIIDGFKFIDISGEGVK